MDFLTLFRKVGLFSKSNEVLEMERVEHRRNELLQQIHAEKAKGERERAGFEQMADPFRKELAAIDKDYEHNYGDLLRINDEKAMRGEGAELATETTRDQLKEIDEEIRSVSFLEDSVTIHQKNLLLSAVAERLNAGYPFADGLAKLTQLYSPTSTEAIICQSLQSMSVKGILEPDQLASTLPKNILDPEICSMVEERRFADSLCKISSVLQSKTIADTSDRSSLATWFHHANNYVTAQQGIYFLGSSTYLDNYRVCDFFFFFVFFLNNLFI